jgi:hypothetical protein
VGLAFASATSPTEALRPAGILALVRIVERFGAADDPDYDAADYEGKLLLELYHAQASNPSPNPSPSPSPHPNPGPHPSPSPHPNPHPNPTLALTLALTLVLSRAQFRTALSECFGHEAEPSLAAAGCGLAAQYVLAIGSSASSHQVDEIAPRN